MRISPGWPAFALVTLVFTVSGWGCAPSKSDVSGKVTYNGVPLNHPNGSIVFVSSDGVQVVAPIAADGTYRAPEVLRGEMKVAVYYTNPKFQEAAKQVKKLPNPKEKEPVAAAPATPITPFLTPAKYASTDTSGFAVKVEGSTTFNAELTGPPIR